MHPEIYKPKNNPSTNVFDERICDKEACPAYFDDEECLEFCNAKLDLIGRVAMVDGKAKLVELCGLPIGFKIVVDE